MGTEAPTVVIVGGGSSAWSAAGLLSSSRSLKVKVIEPKLSQPIGVGESTLPHINNFHGETKLKALRGRSWVDEVDGTAKFTIQFEEFFRLNGEKWVHPFFVTGDDDLRVYREFQLGKSETAAHLGQSEWTERNVLLAKMQAQKFWGNQESSGYPTGFHFDATLYGQYLKNAVLSERPAVELITSSVTEVIRDGNGDVVKLCLTNGDSVTGEYFVDCTGFKSLLSTGETLDYTDRLYCDTAIAAQLPYRDKELQQKNTTHCKAMSAGWVWNVPLQSRIGTGYVYSSRHIDQSHAEQEFRKYLEQRFGYPPSEVTFRRVDFTPRRKKETWKGNVISIGLSGFFLEPLESTGIALTHLALQKLKPLLEPSTLSQEVRRAKFNKCVNQRADEAMEFIDAHYAFSERNDTEFWRDCGNRKLSQVQQKIFDGYTASNIEFSDELVSEAIGPYRFFSAPSWAALLYGNRYQPNSGAKTVSFVEARRGICSDCTYKTQLFKQDFCSECRCLIPLKTKFKSASCPLGKW